MPVEILHVLLVEDDDVDAEAIQRSFRKHNIGNPITVVRDGIEALQVLRGESDFNASQAFVILLDLNMPRMGGIQFLTELRDDPKLSDSMVVVLTTSDLEADKKAAADHNVAGYLVKSKVGEDFMSLIRTIVPQAESVGSTPTVLQVVRDPT